MKLYHYTSLDSFSKIWISHSLLFSESKRTNDVFESKKFLKLESAYFHIMVKKRELKFKDILTKYFGTRWVNINKLVFCMII